MSILLKWYSTLWRTPCHRSNSGLYCENLSDLLKWRLCDFEKNRTTSHKTFSSWHSISLLSKLLPHFYRVSIVRNQNAKKVQRLEFSLIFTLPVSSPYACSIVLHGCLYWVSLLLLALSFFRFSKPVLTAPNHMSYKNASWSPWKLDEGVSGRDKTRTLLSRCSFIQTYKLK